MKLKLLYLLPFFCLLLAGCSDDDALMTVSQNEFKEISYEGGVFNIEMNTNVEWTAVSQTDWCRVSKSEGVGSRTLSVEVEANLGAARTAQVVIEAQGEQHTITFSQQAIPDGQELKYKLPIVFHIIYADENDPKQNIPADEIYAMLDEVNKMYQNAGAETTVDLNMEFVPAEFDPQGNRLEEPGIDRVKWLTADLDPTDVMEDNTRKYVHFLWEPNDYVNILVYRFSSSASNILGISTFPYTTKSYPLEGTDVLEDMNITLANLNYVRGVSINNSYMGNVEDAFTPFAPESYKELITKQVSGSITLAHELGHYFGLRHTFSEAQIGCLDTDFCEDTKSYDKSSYDMFVNQTYQLMNYSADYAGKFDWESLFKRTTCQDEEFTSHNIMDYAYSYLDEFTADQRLRVRHVLDYSPMIPGPKQTRAYLSTKAVSDAPMDLPFSVSNCGPRGLIVTNNK